MSDKEPTPLELLKEAAQQFVQSNEEEPVVITSAVLCWEQIRIGDDGVTMRRVDYASLMDHFSFSADYGTVAIVQAQLIGIGVDMNRGEEGEDEE